MKPKIKFTWQLAVSLLGGLFCIGYVVNFVFTNGYNRPAVFYAWCGLLIALIFYQQHRRKNARALIEREKSLEEKEFEEWAKERQTS